MTNKEKDLIIEALKLLKSNVYFGDYLSLHSGMNNKINNDVIKNALKTNFHIILGERSNGKKYFLESLGYKVITYKEKRIK